ncbi:uncharacterized protein Z519_01254 [Cladophialophora bantiana CBS 173.52]|uniref:DM2 domain-containing protein n=1 Tax=Cladophialophora bantiana (strain ATCC 10958 / CBS 173.52 / CDC B-1940 / NIH 8579) TaxID=1442370 RepID=A0A0D2I394_CLAB1|nr:uncharacterized protein Z519_01254 [Cladophialophora bantiana CBS 173.52]KIW97670.1 hypothetical protein Z519_01254 [Cladophialophora bantiana CBS 173.52]
MNPQMQNYRQFAQAQGRSPAARRPGQIPPVQHAAQQAQAQMMQQQAQQRNAAIEHQLAQRRVRKPTDRNLPDGLEEVVIGDGVEQYKKLREAEKRLDHLMARKRLEIHDNLSKNVKRQKTMRIWISNTVSGHPWQMNPDEEGFTFDSGNEPSCRVKIQGRLLEYDDDDILHSDDEDQEMDDQHKPVKQKQLKTPSKKFTHFFKGMTVEFDSPKANIGEPNQTVTWKKGQNSTQAGDFDAIEFERKADENVNITICLTRDEQPERYRLSDALAETLDMEEADRAEVVMGIWDYVRAMGLQEDEERRSIQCDEPLKRIFDTDTFFFPQAAERLVPHLHPLPPVRLAYTIRVDEDYHKNPEPTIYDVQVTVEDPLRPLIFKLTQNPEHQSILRSIAKLDDELAIVVQALHHHKARHQFFTSMAKDPQKFVERWLSSQKKDLSVLLAEQERGDVAGMEFSKGGDDSVWGGQVVREAVRYRLARAEATGR